MQDRDEQAEEGVNRLREALLQGSHRCVRPPVDRFRHAWLAPMPASDTTAGYLSLRQRGGREDDRFEALSHRGSGDGFTRGDYSLGLFHHDASEAAIELLQHPDLAPAAAGSLLCMLDCAEPSGRVHRAELPHKAREREPAKPVIARFALNAAEAMGHEWVAEHRVYERALAFVRFLEREYVGLHGLFLTHSSLQSGFDNDPMTAGLPDRSVEGPDTNAFMVLEYEALAELARLHGTEAEVRELGERACQLRERMEQLLWREDERGGLYVALRWQHGVGSLDGEVVAVHDPWGRPRPVESHASLLPLYAGVPSAARAERLVTRLLDEQGYWGPHGVRTVPAWSEFFHQAPRVLHFDFKKGRRGPVSNWSGPVWVLSNYYLACGLARYGRHDEAAELALRTARLLVHDLDRTGSLHECYDDGGRGLWPRRGTFLSWNVLVLSLLRDLPRWVQRAKSGRSAQISSS